MSAFACGLVTALFVAGSVGFWLESGLSPEDRFAASSLCAFVALGVGALAWRLALPRGGVFYDETRDKVGFGLTGPRDVWWMERSACAGLWVSEPDLEEPSDPGLFGVVLVRNEAPPILLVETPDPELTQEVARSLQAGLELPLLDAKPLWDHGAEEHDATGWVRVSRRVALHSLMVSLGISALGVGGILVSKVATHPIVSIFIAPVAILTGLVLIILPIVKRLGTEELTREKRRWRYRWRLFGFSWGERDLPAQDSTWRLRVGEGGGARLELVTTEGEVWLGSGATSRSTVSVEGLSGFPERFQRRPQQSDQAPSDS